MKKSNRKKLLIHTLFYLISYLCTIIPSAKAFEWNDPSIFEINKIAPRATFMIYPDKKSAIEYDRTKSSWFISLNSTEDKNNSEWKFYWSKDYNERPIDFFKDDFDISNWKSIPVPSNWELEGFEKLINKGNKYFKNNQNIHLELRSIGSYRRDFLLPDNWNERITYIVFDGVKSAFYLWINGKKVGYSQGSRTPAEFNITKYLKSGKNTIAVEVHSWSDHMYLKDQDNWKLSGIYRDVYLWSVNKTHIKDFKIETNLDKNYKNSELIISGEVTNGNKAKNIDISIIDQENNALNLGIISPTDSFNFKTTIKNPKKWTTETPYLYTILLTYLDENNEIIEIVPQKIGFRKIEINNTKILLNGKSILIKGVNRREHHADSGNVMNKNNMLTDIKLLKKNNFNAVKTYNYPNTSLWYDLCDKYGILVWNATHFNFSSSNKENNDVFKNKKLIEPILINHLKRMIERDKNHSSIIAWSITIDNKDIIDIEKINKFIHEKDSTRLIHIENNHDKDIEFTHVNSKKFISPEEIKKVIKLNPNKPLILSEYLHSLGNSNGGGKEYWNIINENNAVQGGFVSYWMDNGLRQPIPKEFQHKIDNIHVNKTFFSYSNTFKNYNANKQTFKNTNMNGLLNSAQKPYPYLSTHKYLQQNIEIIPIDLSIGKIKIKNKFNFLNLKDIITSSWKIEQHGVNIANGSITDLNIEPNQEKIITLNIPSINYVKQHDYFITINFFAKNNFHPLVEEDHLLAWQQFKLATANKEIEINEFNFKSKNITATNESQLIIVKGSDFEIIFDKITGNISSYIRNGKKYINYAGNPQFSRAKNDNETHQKPQISNQWEKIKENIKLENININDLEGIININIKKKISNINADFYVDYNINSEGEILVNVEYDFTKTNTNISPPPRIGMEWLIAKEFNSIVWYGRKGETYIDRNLEPIGLYSGTIDEQWINYPKPQTNGNKTDVRWIALLNEDSEGLIFKSISKPMEVQASPYDIKTQIQANYNFELNRDPKNIFLNIDVAQSGVGGINSWGATPLKKYQLLEKKYTHTYIITPKTDLE